MCVIIFQEDEPQDLQNAINEYLEGREIEDIREEFKVLETEYGLKYYCFVTIWES